MSDDSQSDDRTEEATQTRREEFRKQGQVVQTKELASSLFFFASGVLIIVAAGFFFEHLSGLIEQIIEIAFTYKLYDNPLAQVASIVGKKLAILLGPVLFVSLVLGVMSSVLQVGSLQVEDALMPKFEKLNPVEGLKRMFSMRALVEGVKALLKMILIGFIAYKVIQTDVPLLLKSMDWELDQSLSFLGKMTFKILIAIGFSVIVVAAFDYFFQWWELEKRMKMTKQEIKEEMKNREVDPQIKGRVRRMQREMANKRMMQKVPEADVIITNPTHIAVALKYGPNMAAPQLIAKGADLVAQRIKDIAREHKIPIIENKPLARTIFKTMKLDQFIPRDLYVAVAEVLSYVYKLKRKRAL